MTSRSLLAAALSLCAGCATAADFMVLRASAPATVKHEGNSTDAVPTRPVVAGDVVSAGPRGKVALQLAGTGLITLSSLGDLQVFEAKPGGGKQPASAKLKLLAGALRVDSRAVNGKPAQDVRLNVGSLKTRLYNADAWAANTAEGDTVCVLAGAVSLQTGGASEERLDAPGRCLRREPDGQLNRFEATSDPVIVGAIAATRFEGSADLVTTLVAEAAAPTPAATIKAAPVPAAASEAVPQSAAGANKGAWTIVVLSLSKPEPIAARTQALAQQGLPATTRTAVINGITMHRVAVGSFATQAEARAYAAGTLAKRGIKGWPSLL